MLSITNELKAKLLAAKSGEEAASLVKANGQEITQEESALLWKEITSKRGQDGKEFSLDELEAVSGGSAKGWEWGDDDIDWLKDGCFATVEAGSHCWSSDTCFCIEVYYKNEPTQIICGVCGQQMAHIDGTITRKYQCRNGHISLRGF